MAIYDPRLFFSKDDRELLRLLALIVLEQEGWLGANNNLDETCLSQQEARDLVDLLDQFVNSKKFYESCYLTEGLFGGDVDGNSLRNIYLSWRTRLGRSRAVANIQWENLLGRIGLWPAKSTSGQIWYRASAQPMSFGHFRKMELRLAEAADVHPAVRDLIDRYVRLRGALVDQVRFGKAKLAPKQVFDVPNQLLDSIRADLNSPVGIKPVKTNKIVGVMTIVMDVGAMYTTRDWSVASFMSQIAGAIPLATLK